MAEENLGAITEQPGAAPSVQTVPETPVPQGNEPQGQPATTPSEPSSQAEVERLQAEVERLKNLQSQADRKARSEQRQRERLEKRFATTQPVSGEGDHTTTDVAETARAEASMIRTAYGNPKYRAVLDADPTLRRIMDSNPLALVKAPLDVEDAVFQLEDFLDHRAQELTPAPSAPAPRPQVVAAPVETTPAPETSTPTANPVVRSIPSYMERLNAKDAEGAVLDKMNDPANWNK